jgi:arylsulfatase A-like enzyme
MADQREVPAHEAAPPTHGSISAGAAAVAAAGALAAAFDVAAHRQVEPLEALAAVSLLGLAGAGGGLILAAILTALERRPHPDALGPRWIAVFLGVAAAGICAGAADVVGRLLPSDWLSAMTWLALAAPLMGVAVGLAALYGLERIGRLRAGAGRVGAMLWGFAALAPVGAAFHGPLPVLAAVCGLGVLGALVGLLRPRFSAPVAVLVLTGLLVASWPHPRPPAPPTAPRAAPAGSSILIVLDTVRADELGAYGGDPENSRTFDRLAKEGALFTQMVSPSGWTLPSHVSMFTGEFPRTHGVGQHHRRKLDGTFVTITSELEKRNFQTAAFSANAWPRVSGLTEPFDEDVLIEFQPRNDLVVARWMRFAGIGWDTWIDRGSAEALEEMGSFLAARDPERPFFVFVNLYEAHDLYLPPAAYREGGPLERLRQILASRRFQPMQWHRAGPRPAEAKRFHALYRGGIRYQDEALGRLLDTVARHVVLDDVAIIVTSDHGENFGEGTRWGHILDVNDLLVHVPFVLRAPRHFQAGSVVEEQHQLMDVHATLRELAGIEAPGGVGHSLLGERVPWKEAFADFVPIGPKIREVRADRQHDHPEGIDWPAWMVRSEGWKLVRFGSGAEFLYRMADDPEEKRDLLAQEPERAAHLRQALDDWMERHPERPPPDPRQAGEVLDEGERARLRALGYVE